MENCILYHHGEFVPVLSLCYSSNKTMVEWTKNLSWENNTTRSVILHSQMTQQTIFKGLHFHQLRPWDRLLCQKNNNRKPPTNRKNKGFSKNNKISREIGFSQTSQSATKFSNNPTPSFLAFHLSSRIYFRCMLLTSIYEKDMNHGAWRKCLFWKVFCLCEGKVLTTCSIPTLWVSISLNSCCSATFFSHLKKLVCLSQWGSPCKS